MSLKINLHKEKDVISDHIREYGCWEPFTMEVITELYKQLPNAVFLDIGANIGYFSLKVAYHFNSRIIAFEPVQKNYDLFLSSVTDNNLQDLITIHKTALSNCNGELDIMIHDDNYGLCSGTFKAHDNISHETVGVKQMDDFRGDFDLNIPIIAKIDVEHMELPVLLGMESMLSQGIIKYIIIEISIDHDEIFDLMVKHGYTKIVEVGFDTDINNVVCKTDVNPDTEYLKEKELYYDVDHFKSRYHNRKKESPDLFRNDQCIVLLCKPESMLYTK